MQGGKGAARPCSASTAPASTPMVVASLLLLHEGRDMPLRPRLLASLSWTDLSCGDGHGGTPGKAECYRRASTAGTARLNGMAEGAKGPLRRAGAYDRSRRKRVAPLRG